VVRPRKGRAGGTRFPISGISEGARGLEEVHLYERVNTTIQLSVLGVFSGQVGQVSANGIFNAARLAGYQAIRDDIRFDRCRLTLTPVFSGTTGGRCILYVEREVGEAISASVLLASDQLERSSGQLSSKLTVGWTPQQPPDRQFYSLSAPSTNLANVNLVADSLSSNGVAVPVATVCWTVTMECWFTLRGRPN
jgi:hypothetical protein